MLGEIKEQIQVMKTTGAATVEPDAQASELAKAFGSDESKVRRWLNIGSAIVLLGAQFACLWLDGFLRHRVEPETARQETRQGHRWEDRPPYEESTGNVLENPRRFTKQEARADLQMMIATRTPLLHGNGFAARWGVRASTSSKWLRAFRAEGLIKRRQVGLRKIAVPATPRPNGTHLAG
jgi:hypothetical protein